MTEEITKVKKPRVSDKDFVQAYLLYKSYADLAQAIGMTPMSVQARASKLRKSGVTLAKYGRVTKKVVDVDGLNALIAQL